MLDGESQQALYDELAAPVVEDVCGGFNGTVTRGAPQLEEGRSAGLKAGGTVLKDLLAAT